MNKEKLFTALEDTTPQIYNSKVMERLTRMHYSVPFIIYIPIIGFFVYRALFIKQMNPIHFLWILPMITIFWSWLEYILHKHFLHRRPDGSATVELANKIHEAHHAYPNDSYRLAVHWCISVPGGIVFYAICLLIFGYYLVDAVFAGLVFYYLVYEFAHISSHKINNSNPILMKIKKHHLRHHFKDDSKDYGFTSGIWDKLFKTDHKD
jgi:sterol desaturase/sphingolipid hydroxylase (fatty acid hydroxylase superfamily)